MRIQGAFPILLFFNLLVPSCHAGSCSICPSGDPITLPDRELNLKYPFPIDTCGKLNTFMGFISDTSGDCEGIRTLGGLCGCPVIEGTCRMCPDSSLVDPSATLANENTEVVQRAPKGLALTCEFVDSYLQSFFAEGDTLCSTTRNIYLPECKCVELPGSEDTVEGGEDVLNTTIVPNANFSLHNASYPWESYNGTVINASKYNLRH